MIDTYVAGKPEFLVHRQAALSATTIGRTFGPSDTYIIIALVLVGVVAPVAAAICLHSFGIPQNDDWAYRIALFRFVGTGHLSFVRWGAMTLLGQILWGVPFALVLGPHLWVASVAGAVLACFGLCAAYLLVRGVLPWKWAAGCILLVLGSPGFLLNSANFMTDVPAYSAEMVCLYLGVLTLRASGRRRWALLAVAMLVGCFGFSIREFAIAAPVAILICLALQDRRHANVYAGAALCTAAACAMIYVLCVHLGAVPGGLRLPTSGSFYNLAAMYFTLAFILAPLIPSFARRTLRSFSWPAAVAGTVTLTVGFELWHWTGAVFAGSFLLPQGSLGIEAAFGPGRPALFPGPVWPLFSIIAVTSGACLAASAARATSPVLKWLSSASTTRGQLAAVQSRAARFHADERGLLVLFAGVAGLMLAMYCLFSTEVVRDRYLYPVVLPVAVLLVGPTTKRWSTDVLRPLGVVVALTAALLGIVVGITTVSVTLNADSYAAGLWKAGKVAVRAGVPPQAVDAAFAWRGYYDPAEDPIFDDGQFCAFVSNSNSPSAVALGELLNFGPAARGRLLQTVTYDELGFAIPERLYVYLKSDAKCAT